MPAERQRLRRFRQASRRETEDVPRPRHAGRRAVRRPLAAPSDGARNRHRRPQRPASRHSVSERKVSAHPSVRRRWRDACPAAEAADAACRHLRTFPVRRAHRKADAAARADVPAEPCGPALRQVRRDGPAACSRMAAAASSCRPHRGAGAPAALDAPRASSERLRPVAHRRARQAFRPRFRRSAAPWKTAKRRCPRPARKPRLPASSRKRKFPASPASCPLFLKQWTCCSYRLS